jgi:predicted nuclease with TOPRIM domain
MTILKFPEDKSLQVQLDERKAELEEVYDNLNRAFALVDKIEEKAASLEAEYNIYLRRYAHALGGVENVEVGYLEYSSGVGVDADEGTIVFTPWSEEDETEV